MNTITRFAIFAAGAGIIYSTFVWGMDGTYLKPNNHWFFWAGFGIGFGCFVCAIRKNFIYLFMAAIGVLVLHAAYWLYNENYAWYFWLPAGFAGAGLFFGSFSEDSPADTGPIIVTTDGVINLGGSSTSSATFTDYREQWEKDLEAEARSPLSARDEKRAHDIIEAMRSQYKGVAYQIGKDLYSEGGHRAMVRMHYRVKQLGGEGRPLESLWDGIGEWRR